MPGKLPIDRVRAAKDAPRVYEREKETFTKKQATLRAADSPVGNETDLGNDGTRQETDDA
jgi:hypothetical protein